MQLTVAIVVSNKELIEDLRVALESLPVRVLFEIPELPAVAKEFLERLDRMRPDLVIVEPTRLPGSIEDVVRNIRATAASPAVFIVNSSPEPDAILAAMRAGASEYLYPPMAGSLKAATERLVLVRQQAQAKVQRQGKTLAFFSAKGGCGATTLACHIAVELARTSVTKVLLADLDLQAGSIQFLLKTKSPYSVADAANNLRRLDRSYWQGLISNGIPNLEIMAAPSEPSAKALALQDLRSVVEFARSQYQWTVVDLGRNLNPLSLGLLDLVDEAYLITTPDVPALHHAKQVIQILLETGYPAAQVRPVLNRLPRRMDVTLDELEKMLGVSIYSTLASDSEGLHEAYSEGRLLNGSGSLGRDLFRLAGKISGVTDERKKKFSLFS